MVIKNNKSKVKILNTIDSVSAMETGMNKAPEGERSKKKITKGITNYTF